MGNVGNNCKSSEDSSNSISSVSTTWNKTAGETDGYDWEGMNDSQKQDNVLGVLETLKDNGATVSKNTQ